MSERERDLVIVDMRRMLTYADVKMSEREIDLVIVDLRMLTYADVC